MERYDPRMPCYLFTLHGKLTWMPDHRRGYVRRDQGILPSDPAMADEYRQRAKHEKVLFEAVVQQAMIDALVEACEHQQSRLHAVFFEPTHVHFLVSWRAQRGWLRVRAKLRESMTRKLNEQFGHREWFSGSGSRKHVKDREHFDYLMTTYRRKHKGLHHVEPPRPST